MSANIRLATPHDAAAVASIYAPYVTDKAASFELVPPTDDEIRARIECTLTHHPWLIFEEDNIIQGYAYSSLFAPRAAYRWSVESTIYLKQDSHRRGIGRALYTSLFAILKEQGFYNVFAGITLPNPASVGIHESFGFENSAVYKNVGYKFGHWHDVGWWQMQLKPLTENPAETISLPELVNMEKWDDLLAAGLKL
jgi:phosphinothricin acetyltransferase